MITFEYRLWEWESSAGQDDTSIARKGAYYAMSRDLRIAALGSSRYGVRSPGFVQGLNNKVGVIQHRAYALRDEE